MKNLFFITAAIIFVAIEGRSQNVFPLDSVIHKPTYFEKTENWCHLNLFDSLTVIKSVLKYSSKTLINEVLIDSCLNDDTPLGEAILYANDILYFSFTRTLEKVLESKKKVSTDYNGIAAYDPKLRQCKDIPIAYVSEYDNKKVQVDLSRTQLYSKYNMSTTNNSVLYIIDKGMEKETMIADFRPYTDKKDYKFRPWNEDKSYGSIEQVCATEKSSYIVKAGVWDMYSIDLYGDVRYFKIANGKIEDLTATVKQWVEEQKIKRNVIDVQVDPIDDMSLSMLSNDASYIRGIVLYRGSGYLADEVCFSMIVNTDLQFVSPVLTLKGTSEYGGKNYNEVGINKQQGKIVNYFMWSNLNDEAQTKVIVPYVFSPRLDILMYQTYGGDVIKKEDLKGFGKYELGILRNLIFAKYNYAFSSEFYQAYFNLYEFYGNKKTQESRVKNVNDKLTETDKANIKLIKGVEDNL